MSYQFLKSGKLRHKMVMHDQYYDLLIGEIKTVNKRDRNKTKVNQQLLFCPTFNANYYISSVSVTNDLVTTP